MTPQSRGKTAKTAVFRHCWQAWQVVRSIAAVRQRPRTPRNWRCSFTFFESFLWHFNEKQRGEVIFRHSRPVSCKNQENGAGKQWSVHAPLNNNNSCNCVSLHVHLWQSCNNIEKGGCCVVCQISVIRTKLLLYHQLQLVRPCPLVSCQASIK